MSVTLDSVSQSASNQGTAGPTITWTHTPVLTLSAVGILLLNQEGLATVASMTYGGTTVPFFSHEQSSAGGQNVQIWGLAAPPGAGGVGQSIVITYTVISSIFSFAFAFGVVGSDPTTCFRAGSGVGFTSESTTTTSVNVPANVGDLCVDVLQSTTFTNTTTGTGQVKQITDVQNAGSSVTGSTSPSTSGTTTMGWNDGSTATRMTQVAAAFQVAPPPTSFDGSGGGAIFKVRRPGWPRYASRRPGLIVPRPPLLGWRKGLVLPNRFHEAA